MNKHQEEASFQAKLKKTAIRNYLFSYSGHDSPLTSSKLQSIFHVGDVVVRQAIGLLRDDGEPIGSCSKGFFYAKTPDQLLGTLNDFRSRIGAVAMRLRALEGTYDRMDGNKPQQALFQDMEAIKK